MAEDELRAMTRVAGVERTRADGLYGELVAMQATRDSLRAQVAAARALLTDLAGAWIDPDPLWRCYTCGQLGRDGHAASCLTGRIAAWLADDQARHPAGEPPP